MTYEGLDEGPYSALVTALRRLTHTSEMQLVEALTEQARFLEQHVAQLTVKAAALEEEAEKLARKEQRDVERIIASVVSAQVTLFNTKCVCGKPAEYRDAYADHVVKAVSRECSVSVRNALEARAYTERERKEIADYKKHVHESLDGRIARYIREAQWSGPIAILYRLLDADGNVVYIGESKAGFSRLNGHGDKAYVSYEWMPASLHDSTRRDQESAAIRAYAQVNGSPPKYNKQRLKIS